MSIYEAVTQRRALQTQACGFCGSGQFGKSPGMLPAVQKPETSIQPSVPFTLPVHLLHLLSDIFSSRPEGNTNIVLGWRPQMSCLIWKP